jgi:hypothetical protein
MRFSDVRALVLSTPYTYRQSSPLTPLHRSTCGTLGLGIWVPPSSNKFCKILISHVINQEHIHATRAELARVFVYLLLLLQLELIFLFN